MEREGRVAMIVRGLGAWLLLALAVHLGASCASGGGGTVDAGTPLGTPGDFTRTMARWPSRSYDVHVPPSYDGFAPFPVILALHGGGGSRASQQKLGCPRGDLADPGCFERVAGASGFIVVYPDGTGAVLAPNLRTWNAGGGSGGWQCVCGSACTQGVDDIGYFGDLLADLSKAFRIDAQRIYATGISNGGAMSHRLACQLPGNIAAIAPVAGENQYATTEPCTPSVPVLDIHGTADPCWPYDGGVVSCLDTNPGAKIAVTDSISGWLDRDGCDPTPTDDFLPDLIADGTNTIRHRYQCQQAEVQLYQVVDGGHTWPGGFPYSTAVGPTSMDFSANTAIIDFFAAHR